MSALLSTPPTQLVFGPRRHGVTEYARDLAAAVRRCEPAAPVVHVDDPAALDGAVRAAGRAHLHVTDGLFGDTLEEAMARVTALTRLARVSITFHDVPQPSDGEKNLPRRAAAYRAMAAGAAGVAVSSRHEAQLLAQYVDPGLEAAVIPLGTRVARSPEAASPGGAGSRTASAPRAQVLVAGYVYPGKGHDEAIAAASLVRRRLDTPIEVVALGGVSRGHDAEADRLAAQAIAGGVALTITGYLPDDAYRAAVRGPGVPVVAHQHYSASRSLLDWAEQGRRPVVVDTRYTREMAELRPGTLHLATPETPGGVVEALADGIEAGIRDPAATALPSGHPIAPTLDDAASAYRAWWGGLAW